MRRRQALATLGTMIPFAGCLTTVTVGGSTDEPPTQTTTAGVEITAPTVTHGETAIITIDAQSVSHLRFSELANIDAAIAYEDAEFSPEPDVIWQVVPPTWQWSPAESITGDVPVSISEKVEPGVYQYAIAVQQDDAEEELVEGFTVTVRG